MRTMKTQWIFAVLIILITACADNKQPAISPIKQDSTATDEPADSILPGADAKADSYYYNIELAEIPIAVRSLVPEGYEGLDTATGDLNGDAYDDLIVILRKTDEINEYDWAKNPKKRPMLIFVG